MIGRLPNRSDKTPSQGENKNCISAKTTANRAVHFAASVIWPPRKSRISLGRTGIIKPIARMSSVNVTRIKMTAAGRDFMRLKHQRNVVAAVVSTTEKRRTPLLIYRDDAAFLPLAKNASARQQNSWARSICDCQYRQRRNRRGERGHIVDRKVLREKIAPRLGPVEIQIHDDLFIAPVTEEERELSMLYLNHSCNPNLGHARRDHVCGHARYSRSRRTHA